MTKRMRRFRSKACDCISVNDGPKLKTRIWEVDQILNLTPRHPILITQTIGPAGEAPLVDYVVHRVFDSLTLFRPKLICKTLSVLADFRLARFIRAAVHVLGIDLLCARMIRQERL